MSADEIRDIIEQTTHIQDLLAALEPICHFIEQFDRRPLMGLADDFYGIHTGTEYEARIRLSNFREIRDIVLKVKNEK